MKYIQYLSIVSLFLILISCNSNQVDAPDVSNIDGSFEWIHFEELLHHANSEALEDSIHTWRTKYPDFWDIYVMNVLGFPMDKMSEQDLALAMKDFLNFRGTKEILQDIDSVYGDTEDIHQEFEEAFQYVKYYFPHHSVPTIYSTYTEFSVQRFLFESNGNDAIGIGMELFLGEDYPYARMFPDNAAFSSYLTRSYNREHLVKRVLEAWIEDWLPITDGGDLLNQMVKNGKKLYILDHILPYTSDTVIMEYTENQMEWVEDNELQMWAYLLENDLFYSNDINKINKLVNPSPTSTGMPDAAPSRTANYLGWKIVEAFMDKNPEMSMQELIDYSDAQKILEISRFKPKRR